MATAEELLATVGNEEDYIVIDSDLRTMTFPASVKNIGVENDKDVHKLNFMMPRYFGEYDLSTFSIRINYLNAQGDGDMYVVTDPTVEEDAIYFTWLVGRHACLYRGAVTFIVCLKLADGEGDVAQEFNTTLASLQVLPGLETEPTILETDYDIIEQLLLTIQDTNDKIKAVLDSGMTAEELGDIAKEQKTLKARMDEFASLPEGSTAGDAELTDIRVAADGTTYESAGDAVRRQVDGLSDKLEIVSNGYEIIAYTLISGYRIGEDGNLVEASGHNSTSHFQVTPGETIIISNPHITYNNAWYDENDEFISKFSVAEGSATEIIVPSNAYYAAISNTKSYFFKSLYRNGMPIINSENIDLIETEINDIKSFDDVLQDDMYTVTSTVNVELTINSYELTALGSRVPNSNARLRRYSVSSGIPIQLRLRKDTAGVCVFQSVIDVPPAETNTLIVGKVVTTSQNSIVIVPEGAVCLWVSELKTNETNSVSVVSAISPDNSRRIDVLESFSAMVADEIYGDSTPITNPTPILSYKLNVDGTRSYDATMRLKRYSVINGSQVKLTLSKDSAGVCVFQSTTDVPSYEDNTSIVGDVLTNALTNAVIKVPEGAVCLWVSELKTNETNIVDTIEQKSLRDYYYASDWLENKIDEINEKTSIMNGVSFIFITDLHFMSNALQSKYLLKEVLDKSAVPFVLCGGDFAPAYGTQDALDYTYKTLMEYIAIVGKDKWFAMEGNHDFYVTNNTVSPSVRVSATYAKTYDTIYRNSERYQSSAELLCGCYAIDNDIQKTRYIVLNSCEPNPNAHDTEMIGAGRVTSRQLSWLCNALIEKDDYKVVVFSHIPSDSALLSYSSSQDEIQNVLKAFASKSVYEGTSFASTTNELICHVCGHSHADGSHVDDGVLTIMTTCDAWYKDDGYGATVGTITEQAFDVYCLNYDLDTIDAIRIGRGSNRKWQKNNGIWAEVTI